MENKISKAIKILQAFEGGKTVEIKWDASWEKCYKEEDLFYAFSDKAIDVRIKPEPTYRPYANAEEFLQASREHGPHIKWGGVNIVPVCSKSGISFSVFYGNKIFSRNFDYKHVKDVCLWEDETTCGVLEG